MFNTYNNLPHKIFTNEHFSSFELDENQTAKNKSYDDESFIEICDILRSHYEVMFKLLGEENFKLLTLNFIRLDPTLSVNSKNYGITFSEFLGNTPELDEYLYIKFVAKLDWFWSMRFSEKNLLVLPKGTLESWGHLNRDEDDIQIDINYQQDETLKIEKLGNQYSILSL